MSFSPLISLNLKMRRETKEKENEIKREIWRKSVMWWGNNREEYEGKLEEWEYERRESERRKNIKIYIVCWNFIP